MRRLLIALPLLLAPAATGVAHAAHPAKLPHKITVVDAPGDWAIAGEDILRGTLSGTAKRFHVDLALAGPVPTAPSYYQVQLKVGCHMVVLAVNTANGQVTQNTGAAGASEQANFYTEYTCDPDASGQYAALDSTEDVPTIVGNHLVWDVRYLKDMRSGAVASDIFALTDRAGIDAAVIYVGPRRVTPVVGDRAATSLAFALG